MRFIETRRGEVPHQSADVALEKDGWDDNNRYETLYRVRTYEDGVWRTLGQTRIGYRGQLSKLKGEGVTKIEGGIFEELPEGWISLGLDEDYYETLYSIGPSFAIDILTTLRDMAYYDSLGENWREEGLIKYSLMRGKDEADFETLKRRAKDEGGKVPFTLRYCRDGTDSGLVSLDFPVDPHSVPSTNIHAIIGSNGAGKSTLLRDIVSVALGEPTAEGLVEIKSGDGTHEAELNKLVFVSYSIFDELDIGKRIRRAKKSQQVEFVGVNSSENGEDYAVIEGADGAAEDHKIHGHFLQKISAMISAEQQRCAHLVTEGIVG